MYVDRKLRGPIYILYILQYFSRAIWQSRVAKFFPKTLIRFRYTAQGYTKPREYIVTEWPLRHTCGEFWSLVYDYECAAVVVLCVPAQGSTNFPSFWPEGRHSKKYGPVFTIDHISHNHYTNIKTWVRTNLRSFARFETPKVSSFQITPKLWLYF